MDCLHSLRLDSCRDVCWSLLEGEKKTYSERMCIITGTQTNRERCLKNHVFTSWKRGICIVYMSQKLQQDAWQQASGSSETVWVTFCFEVAMAFMKMLLWHITNLNMVTDHIQHFTVIIVGSFKKNNAKLLKGSAAKVVLPDSTGHLWRCRRAHVSKGQTTRQTYRVLWR